MNELHKAYNILGLEPGTEFDNIKRRYRILVLAWHPDRMTNAEGKKEAEEELKKINNNFEKLKKHFETEHKSGPSCLCQPAAAGPPPGNSRSGSSNQKSNSRSSADSSAGATAGQSDAEKKRHEEESARKRSEERERKAAEEEAARRAASAAKRATEKQQAGEDALKELSLNKDEALRWKCAVLIGVTFLSLVGYCWVGCAVRDMVKRAEQQWRMEHRPLAAAAVFPTRTRILLANSS